MWQPIETAPKDGQNVIVASASESGFYTVGEAFYEDQWFWSGCRECSVNDAGFEATHWMPLPEPPK